MKTWTRLLCLATIVLMSSVLSCASTGYSVGRSSRGAESYGGTSGGRYGGASSSGGGNYGGVYKGSYASDALKNYYNNLDGYKFNFGYNIEDPHYNNYQSRYESGSADPKGQVSGSYSLVDADGSKRTVNYVADWLNGFRATVQDKNGVTQHGYNTGSYVGGRGGGYGSGGTSYDAGGYGGSSSSSGGGGRHGGSTGKDNRSGSSGKY